MSCSEVDPGEDTESRDLLRRIPIGYGCSEVDPGEDTESGWVRNTTSAADVLQ